MALLLDTFTMRKLPNLCSSNLGPSLMRSINWSKYKLACTGGQLKKLAASGQGGPITVGERTLQIQPGQVRSFRFLSGHLDASDLAIWLSRQAKDKVRITCVHGEPDGLKKNAESLRAAGFRNVEVAERGKAQTF